MSTPEPVLKILHALSERSCPACDQVDYLEYKCTTIKHYEVFPRRRKLDYALGNTVFDNIYHCRYCETQFYNQTKETWCSEALEFLGVTEENLTNLYNTISDGVYDYEFLSNGGQDHQACWWFLFTLNQTLMDQYITKLKLIGQYTSFPPPPPHLIEIPTDFMEVNTKSPINEKPTPVFRRRRFENIGWTASAGGYIVDHHS